MFLLTFYQYTGTSQNTISANHLTPVQRYQDDLTFTLSTESGNMCKVEVCQYIIQ